MTLADSSIWLQHVAVELAFAGMLAAAIAWARSWRDTRRVRRAELTLVAIGFAFSAAVNWWWLRPSNFTLEESLPLQMCDLVGVFAPLALLTKARWLRALLHFWGIGLCSQWVFTPVVQVGAQSMEFWISFMVHASILGGAAWDTTVGGYRPRRDWSDWRIAMVCAVAYTGAMIPLDIAIGANYGYLGPTKPDATTIVDYLGPWPWRIGWIVLLAATAMTVIQVAWMAGARLGWVRLAETDRWDARTRGPSVS